MTAPALLQKLAKDYLDGDNSAFWQHKQSGQWLIKHSALEVVAAKAGIRFDLPVFIESEAGRSVAMVVTGRYAPEGAPERAEWSIGEASPKNTQQSYPYAMAEKRGKDRVILKLLNLHGIVYSEDEADDFKASRPTPEEHNRQKRQQQVAAWAKAEVENVEAMPPEERLSWAAVDANHANLLWAKTNWPRLYDRFSKLGVEVS